MKLERPADTPEGARHDAMSDGMAALIGALAGAASGLFLGLIVAAATVPLYSLTSAIVISHVTLAMVAMGAWCAPSIVSDPMKEHATNTVATERTSQLAIEPSVEGRSETSAAGKRDSLADEISAAP